MSPEAISHSPSHPENGFLFPADCITLSVVNGVLECKGQKHRLIENGKGIARMPVSDASTDSEQCAEAVRYLIVVLDERWGTGQQEGYSLLPAPPQGAGSI